ncbi:prophage Lp1 protein 31 [Lactiplantibacillus plantarum]|uniref:DUF1642 domain-containing protein n=1 Tax=Lactiplantibacillus plantarum TaxID=1590 RepID=UPI0007B54983|nr:DUF1642 domain-containing protein [Lactiplantibacillus plantarum]KZU30300.1 prophage Lp1 protein 31 [Lactiplantibacillus plantarum]KZU82640.1 prophage Lp1 protein 31 [Lactiplantibacillus plantarum]
MKFYSKQPIEAEQFDGSQTSLFGYEVMPDSLLDALTGEPAYYSILIDDVESELDDFPDDNEVSFEVGDWIVKEANDIKVLTDEEFKQQYAELPVIPKEVADWIDKCKKDMVSICWAMDEPNLPEKVADYFRKYYTREQWIEIQDTFARAWLDGYTVEEDK